MKLLVFKEPNQNKYTGYFVENNKTKSKIEFQVKKNSVLYKNDIKAILKINDEIEIEIYDNK